jgi:hypothetical protein
LGSPGGQTREVPGAACGSRPAAGKPADKSDADTPLDGGSQASASATSARRPDPSVDDCSIEEFWKAFILLSDLAYPATVESIRFYFRSYYGSDSQGYLAKSTGRTGERKRWFPRVAGNSFAALTFLALFMAIGLSLISYIGSTALRDYDADYEHWSEIQIIARALDESATLRLETEPDGKKIHLSIERPTRAPEQSGAPAVEANMTQPMRFSSTTDAPSTKEHHIPDPPLMADIEVPTARRQRIEKLLLDVTLGDKNRPSLQYACSSILDLFRRARSEQAGDPQPEGTLTQKQCQDLLAEVPPHEIMIADDLTLTFSSLKADRQTLLDVVGIAKFPVRIWQTVIGEPMTWAYRKLLAIPARAGEHRTSQGSANQEQADDFPGSTADVFNLFVLLQQRHAPVPVILPLGSARDFTDIFDARLSVAIIQTYLLTLAFGFLGACVFVLREINRRLENFTLAPSLFPRYRARILLGMVAGPMIGLFFDQDGHLLSFATSATNAPSLTNQLSASAIAFVAGFSIEILFAVLDRLIRIIQDFAGADSHSLATPR